jgi:hypothetical protein
MLEVLSSSIQPAGTVNFSELFWNAELVRDRRRIQIMRGTFRMASFNL